MFPLYFLLVWSRPRHFPRTVTSTNQIMVMQCHANTSYILHCMATVVRDMWIEWRHVSMSCYYCGFAQRYPLQLQFYHGFPLSLCSVCRLAGLWLWWYTRVSLQGSWKHIKLIISCLVCVMCSDIMRGEETREMDQLMWQNNSQRQPLFKLIPPTSTTSSI